MTGKSNFSPEEWEALLEGVLMAGLAVGAATSGHIGVLKDSFAASLALVEARFGPNELIRSILSDFGTPEGRAFVRDSLRELSGAAGSKAKSIETLKEVAMLLEARAPQDAATVKEWLYQISQRVAEAGAEGGFLGFGGAGMTSAEKFALPENAECAATLGASAASSGKEGTPFFSMP